jgi:hypothetical protein
MDVALVTVRNPTDRMGRMRRMLKVWHMRQMS